MTRARSRADQTEAQIAAAELSRGRTKESLAWDLVNQHDTEISHINRRLGALEASTRMVAADLTDIKSRQMLTEHQEREVIARLNAIVDAAKEAAKEHQADKKALAALAQTKRSDMVKNLIALGGMAVAILATVLRSCDT